MKTDSMIANRHSLSQRIPYKLKIEANGVLRFRWLYVGNCRFVHPFFEESVASCLALPENAPDQIPVTGWQEVISAAEISEGVEVTSLIFHASRCGSTLLTQMLNEDERCIVLAEVPLLDALLRLRLDHPAAQDFPLEKLFRSVVRLLGRKVSGQEQYLVLKMDSWHTLYLQQIREWYQRVPVVLMFRDPLEIARSHSRQPGMHAVPGVLQPSIFGLTPEQLPAMTANRYLAHVLCTYYNTYRQILLEDGNAYLLNYHDGPVAFLKKFCLVSGIPFTDELEQRAQQRSRYHSKTPNQIFSGDANAQVHANEYNDAMEQFNLLLELG